MLTVTMFTPNTPYETVVLPRLIKSMDAHGVDYICIPIMQTGSWAFNCGQNASVIYDAMVKYQTDILYVDADAEFKEYPVLFDAIDCDVAIHRIKYPERERLEYCTGTLYCAYNERVIRVLKSWALLNTKQEDDQQNLEAVLKEKTDIKLYDLPQEYCYIVGNRVHKNKACMPVIVHHQASRQYKNNIYGRNY